MTEVVGVSGSGSPFLSPICERLASEGYDVVVLTEDGAEGPLTTAYPVSTTRDVAASGRSLAGLVLCDTYFNYTPGSWLTEPELTTHFAGIVLNRLAVVDALRDQLLAGSGVVFVTTAETWRGAYGALAYVAAQAATHSAVKSLANLLGRSGVRVNAVAPGWIDSVLEDESAQRTALVYTPLGRLGTVAEVAAAVRFLVGNDASYISGQLLAVDGAYLCSDPAAEAEFSAAQRTDE